MHDAREGAVRVGRQLVALVQGGHVDDVRARRGPRPRGRRPCRARSSPCARRAPRGGRGRRSSTRPSGRARSRARRASVQVDRQAQLERRDAAPGPREVAGADALERRRRGRVVRHDLRRRSRRAAPATGALGCGARGWAARTCTRWPGRARPRPRATGSAGHVSALTRAPGVPRVAQQGHRVGGRQVHHVSPRAGRPRQAHHEVHRLVLRGPRARLEPVHVAHELGVAQVALRARGPRRSAPPARRARAAARRRRRAWASRGARSSSRTHPKSSTPECDEEALERHAPRVGQRAQLARVARDDAARERHVDRQLALRRGRLGLEGAQASSSAATR